MTTFDLNKNTKITKKDIEEIENAKTMEIVYDDDSPQFTKAQLVKMIAEQKNREKNIQVSLRVKTSTIQNAKALEGGYGYTSLMAKVLNNVFDNPELLKQCIN